MSPAALPPSSPEQPSADSASSSGVAVTPAAVPEKSSNPEKSSTSGKPKQSTQGPLTMWHGLDWKRYREFKKLQPLRSWGRASQIASLPLLAAYNSAARMAESAVYGRRIERATIPEEPLFIVGHWRSGTTLLHNLICQDPQYTFPNLYQCVFPHHFLVSEAINTRLTGWMMPNTRPMDNVPCGWDLPQEDEIALCLLDLVSPYRMLADMRMPVYARYIDIATLPADEVQRWKDSLTLLMRKLAVRDSRKQCLKSPSHTARVGLLTEMFPTAKFLYVHRDPFRVYQSTNHLRRTMWGENALSTEPPPEPESQTLDCYELTIKAYERDKGKVPAGQLHEIAYRDLSDDPIGCLRESYAALDIAGFDRLEELLAPQVPALKAYKKNSFTPPDPAEVTRVKERLRFAYEAYGYPLD